MTVLSKTPATDKDPSAFVHSLHRSTAPRKHLPTYWLQSKFSVPQSVFGRFSAPHNDSDLFIGCLGADIETARALRIHLQSPAVTIRFVSIKFSEHIFEHWRRLWLHHFVEEQHRSATLGNKYAITLTNSTSWRHF